MSNNFNYPFQAGTESLPTDPTQRLGGIRPSGNEVNDEFYQETIERNSGLIEAFLRQSRQEADLSGLEMYFNSGQYPEFDINYIRQFGKERVNISPKPKRPKDDKKKPEPEIIEDIMKDGYIGIIVYSSEKPADWTRIDNPGTVNERSVQQIYHNDILEIKLNNTFLTNYTIESNKPKILIFRFGDNALNFHSYRNTLNPNEQLQAILPIRVEKDSQLKQELFAYFLYDDGFMKAFVQQFQTLKQYEGFSLSERRDIYTKNEILPFEILDIGQFDTNLLSDTDENILEIISTYKSPDNAEEPELEDNYAIRGDVIVFGEFFDRNPHTFRFVNQSWKYPQGTYSRIRVNDKPLKLFALCNSEETNFGVIRLFHDGIAAPFIGKLHWKFKLSSESEFVYPLTEEIVGDNVTFISSSINLLNNYLGRNKNLISLTTYDYTGIPEDSNLRVLSGKVWFDDLIGAGTYFVNLPTINTDYDDAYADWVENNQDIEYNENMEIKSIITDWYKFTRIFVDRADFIEEDNWLKD